MTDKKDTSIEEMLDDLDTTNKPTRFRTGKPRQGFKYKCIL